LNLDNEHEISVIERIKDENINSIEEDKIILDRLKKEESKGSQTKKVVKDHKSVNKKFHNSKQLQKSTVKLNKTPFPKSAVKNEMLGSIKREIAREDANK